VAWMLRPNGKRIKYYLLLGTSGTFSCTPYRLENFLHYFMIMSYLISFSGRLILRRLISTFSNARPISDALLTWLKDGAGKKKQTAYEYWKTLDTQVPADDQTITRKMQHFLFLEIYGFYVKEAKRLTIKDDVRTAYLGGAVLDWGALPQNVIDVLTDLTYRGDYTGSNDARGNTRKLIVPAVYKDLSEGIFGKTSNLYKVMFRQIEWREIYGVDANRFKRRYEEIK
jgi:hypothetical protein